MSTEEKKKNTKKSNNNYIIYAAIGIVALLVIGFFLIKGCSSSSNNETNNEPEPNSSEKIGAKEQDIINAYGMSKKDAIDIVKEIYNSENFEFSADINEDSMYVVSVKNTITESIDKYIVDPTSSEHNFYLVLE